MRQRARSGGRHTRHSGFVSRSSPRGRRLGSGVRPLSHHDRQRFAGDVVDQRRRADPPPVEQRVGDGVHRPLLVRLGRDRTLQAARHRHADADPGPGVEGRALRRRAGGRGARRVRNAPLDRERPARAGSPALPQSALSVDAGRWLGPRSAPSVLQGNALRRTARRSSGRGWRSGHRIPCHGVVAFDRYRTFRAFVTARVTAEPSQPREARRPGVPVRHLERGPWTKPPLLTRTPRRHRADNRDWACSTAGSTRIRTAPLHRGRPAAWGTRPPADPACDGR